MKALKIMPKMLKKPWIKLILKELEEKLMKWLLDSSTPMGPEEELNSQSQELWIRN